MKNPLELTLADLEAMSKEELITLVREYIETAALVEQLLGNVSEEDYK